MFNLTISSFWKDLLNLCILALLFVCLLPSMKTVIVQLSSLFV